MNPGAGSNLFESHKDSASEHKRSKRIASTLLWAFICALVIAAELVMVLTDGMLDLALIVACTVGPVAALWFSRRA